MDSEPTFFPPLEAEQAVFFLLRHVTFLREAWLDGHWAVGIQPAYPPCRVPQGQCRHREVLDGVNLHCTFLPQDVRISHQCCIRIG